VWYTRPFKRRQWYLPNVVSSWRISPRHCRVNGGNVYLRRQITLRCVTERLCGHVFKYISHNFNCPMTFNGGGGGVGSFPSIFEASRLDVIECHVISLFLEDWHLRKNGAAYLTVVLSKKIKLSYDFCKEFPAFFLGCPVSLRWLSLKNVCLINKLRFFLHPDIINETNAFRWCLAWVRTHRVFLNHDEYYQSVHVCVHCMIMHFNNISKNR
jgi:hypothetical protein